jgi:ADP-heptose:LPS heptosyltransferase
MGAVNHDITTNPAQKTIALLQLTRIGDIIQTIQMVKDLKKKHPNFRIVMIGRKQFLEPTSFLFENLFDEVFTLDFDKIINTNGALTLAGVKENIRTFVDKINVQNISVLVNLSFSKTSNYLSNLIEADHKVGTRFNNFANLEITDKWSQFVYTNVMTGPMCPFNLVDVFKLIVGVKSSQNNDHLVKKPFKKKNKIILHPFASQAKKVWKPSKWVEVIYKLLKNDSTLKINIVGAASEKDASEEIVNSPILAEFKNKIINHTGLTSIKELYDLFDDQTLFVGHDSMVGHLAALKQVQTLTVSLGTVRPYETTPYGENNYNLSPKTKCFPCFPDDDCAFHQCHADVSYQTVVSSVRQLCDQGVITQEYISKENSTFHLNAANIYKSKFSTNGLMQLENVIHDNVSTSDVMRTFYRLSWLYMLNEIEENLEYPEISKKVSGDLITIMKGLEHFYELSDFGKKYSRYILEEISGETPNLTKIKSYSAKIDEIDTLQAIIKENFPLLSPLVDYSTIVKGNLFGTNVVELTESSFYSYNDMANHTKILYDLNEKTISEYKIKNNKLDTISQR